MARVTLAARLAATVAAAALAGGALGQDQAPAQAQASADYTPPPATAYEEVTKWPDFTGVWGPDWSILFGAGGRRPEVKPALTPAAQVKYDAFLAKQKAEGVDQSAQVHCLPPGMPNIMRQPYPIEFLYSPGRVTLFAETYSQARRIYVDGQELPEDPDPLFNGNSVGHWDGDALVVDTVGFAPSVMIAAGVGHGDKMKIHERFWLTAPDVMRVETTITDPDVLTEPLVQQLAYRKHADWQIREYVCEENNRLTPDGGGANIDLKLDDAEDAGSGDKDPFADLPPADKEPAPDK